MVQLRFLILLPGVSVDSLRLLSRSHSGVYAWTFLGSPWALASATRAWSRKSCFLISYEGPFSLRGERTHAWSSAQSPSKGGGCGPRAAAHPAELRALFSE